MRSLGATDGRDGGFGFLGPGLVVLGPVLGPTARRIG